MVSARLCVHRLLTGSVLACVLASGLTGAQHLRQWSVETSVQIRYLVENDDGQLVAFSASGTHFFFVTKRGDLACDCNRYELKVYSAADVRASLRRGESRDGGQEPRPLRAIEFATESNHAGISDARWIDAGAAIAFLGAQGTSRPQVYRLTLASGKLDALTSEPHGVVRFDWSAKTLVYLAQTEARLRSQLDAYPVSVVQGYDLGIAFGLSDARYYGTFVRRLDEAESAELIGRPENNELAFWQTRYWLSPDGQYAVVLAPVLPEEVPPWWYGYDFSREGVAGLPVYATRSFSLINLKTHQIASLLDAPTGEFLGVTEPSPVVLWSEDSRHAALVNTTLPMDSAKPERRRSSYMVDFDIRTMSWQVLSELGERRQPLSPTVVAWSEPGREFTMRSERSNLTFRFADGRWSRNVRAASAALQPNIRNAWVRVEQSANRPPNVVAYEGARRVELLSPDPVLRNSRWADVSTVTWRDAHSRNWLGGLTLPRGSHTASAPPLVIQIYNFEPDRFLPDGSFSTAYAAQAMTDSGFAVLQMRIRDVDGMSTPREGPSFVEGVDAAVDYLAGRGLVDPSRVGIVGFSRGGYLVAYALTNPGKTKFAAAIDADGGDPSYVTYLTHSVLSAGAAAGTAEFEALYGGGSFWANREQWLAHAPGFNTHRVTAPVLLTVSGVQNRASALELYSGLRLNGKPVELLHFPQGQHELQRPRERQASLQATVDWMTFWLLQRQDDSPNKREQFSRWENLRRLYLKCCGSYPLSATGS